MQSELVRYFNETTWSPDEWSYKGEYEDDSLLLCITLESNEKNNFNNFENI